MSRITVLISGLLILISLSITSFDSISQNLLCAGNEANERLILDEMNRYRVNNGTVVLVPNETLQDVACIHARSLANSSDFGNVFVRDDTDIGDWLLEEGYAGYPGTDDDGYRASADLFVNINRLDPLDLMREWNADVENYPSYFNRRFGDTGQPYYKQQYREVGIVQLFDSNDGLNYYVIVFGAEPNSFPLGIVLPDAPNVVIFEGESISSQDIYISIAREFHDTTPMSFDTIDRMRVSELPLPEAIINPCTNQDLADSGELDFYRARYEVTLSAGFGEKTLYIDICDNLGTHLEYTFSLILIPEPTPTLTPTPTATITPTPTTTNTATNTATATNTPEFTITPAPTNTPEISSTPTPTPTLTSTPPPSATLRLTWDDAFLVIANPEENGISLDLGGLIFWRSDGIQFMIDENANADEISNIEQGDCIVIYSFNSLGGQEPPIEDVRTRAVCNGIVFVPTFAGNLFWTNMNELFEVQQDDRFIGSCELGQDRVCMIDLDADLESTLTGLGELINIRAIWRSDVFYLINNTNSGVDVSELRLVSSVGEIAPDDWILDDSANYTLDNMRPGSCLVAYLGTLSEPPPLSRVTCSRIMGEAPLGTSTDLIWTIPQGGFTPYIGEEAVADSCDVSASSNLSCDIPAPSASN